jgi:hypothetical protein
MKWAGSDPCPSQVATYRDTISHFQDDETTMNPFDSSSASFVPDELDTNLLAV